ncbi:MAG: hypothetical protein IJQ79_02045 [Bacteroidales bacterium]|nr:hypothetical protein [Bacteroidales bacterium]
MEKTTNPIIEELTALSKFKWGNQLQQEFFNRQAADAVPVEVSSVKSVFSPEEIRLIKAAVQPKKGQCYRNAALLTELFPDRCKYVEGFGWNRILKVEHAFNRVGDKYVDITWELVLGEDVTSIPYVSLIEASRDEVLEDIFAHDNITGDYYRHELIERLGL